MHQVHYIFSSIIKRDLSLQLLDPECIHTRRLKSEKLVFRKIYMLLRNKKY